MHAADTETINLFSKYAASSMAECVKEAEKSVMVAGKILEIITSDVSRVSKMSDDTVNILEDLRKSVEANSGPENTNSQMAFPNNRSVRELILTIKGFSKSNSEIQGLLMPIIESLQFQDRVRQQMENVTKMFPTWLKMREELESGQFDGLGWEDTAAEFGERQLKNTVTPEERDTIQAFIPNLKVTAAVSNDDDFFF